MSETDSPGHDRTQTLLAAAWALRIEVCHLLLFYQLFYADDDVSAAEILIIVSERADGVQYLFRIPTAFVPDSGTLYRLVQDQLLDFDRQRHGCSSYTCT